MVFPTDRSWSQFLSSLRVIVGGSAIVLGMGQPSGAQTLPTNNNPANQIRFSTAAEADARRSQLVNYIWNGGLPSAVPAATYNVSLPFQATDIDPLNVAKVDRLDANVSGWDFHLSSYLIHPTTTNANTNRVVLVQQGHSNSLEAGVGATANHLLQNGFTVAVMHMPLLGWNSDQTAVIPGRGTFTYSDHNQMITNTALNQGGQGFRLFLEPVVQTINHVSASMPHLQDVGMIGLSGGGWYTQMMAAIDPRIKLSVPVAGSSPLYHRNTDPSSVGDAEQYYAPLYNENIAPNGSGGGVATWLEIYALGSYGSGRHQVQVTNLNDNCCFSGTFADSYKSVMVSKVDSLGSGKFEYYRDATHHSHQISPHVIQQVISPLFGITNPLPLPSGLPIEDVFNDQAGVFPTGWKLDVKNGPGATAIERHGQLTLYSTGAAAVAHERLVNVASLTQLKVSIEIAGMSADGISGVVIAADADRSRYVGASIDATTKQLFLDADAGGAFNGSTDRIILGRLPNYDGGLATIELLLDPAGFSVGCDAGLGGSYQSGFRPWSDVPGGFSLSDLGHHARLLLQCLETDAGPGAWFSIDSISVFGDQHTSIVPEPSSWMLYISGILVIGVRLLRKDHLIGTASL